MKKSESLKLGLVYEHLHQVLHAEKELVEVTFHYGMGARVHLDTHQLGICVAFPPRGLSNDCSRCLKRRERKD